jgi:hypothetical protein
MTRLPQGRAGGRAAVVAALVFGIVAIASALWYREYAGVPQPTAPTTPGETPAGSDCGRTLSGSIQVCPGEAAIGQLVTVRGTACAAPDAEIALVLEGAPEATTGTYGSKTFSGIRTGSDRSFQFEFRIPEQLDSYRGRGGGPTTRGTYWVSTRPLGCYAELTVR